MKPKYIRLLSYENALKVIGYVEKLDIYENYANITPGGITLQILDEDWQKVLDFIVSLGVRFEITDEHPSIVTDKIIKYLKNIDVI